MSLRPSKSVETANAPIDVAVPAIMSSAKRPAPLAIVSRLADALAASEIRCCLWKGTFSLASVVAGRKDIDLLVDAEQADKLAEILAALEFKTAEKPGAADPITAHYFAYEPSSSHFVHLHLHYAVVLGDPLQGEFQLPIAEPYLETSLPEFPFPVPQPEFEFIVFVLRMTLEQSKRKYRRAEALSTTRAKEFDYLCDLSSRSSLEALLREHLPSIGIGFFDECCEALRGSDKSIVTLSHALKSRLKEAGLRRPSGSLQRLFRRLMRAFRVRILKRPSPSRRLEGGGKAIALVGGDGSGKSTAIKQMEIWLEEHFDVQAVHMGKPPRGWFTLAARGMLKVARKCNNLVGRRSDRTLLPVMLWRFCTARDRYLAYRRIRRATTRGQIVISDRWPLPNILAMDGPQIRELASGERHWFARRLADAEEKWLDRIDHPDLLVVLKLDPDTAVLRKPEENAEFVYARGLEVWNVAWADETRVIDASQSPEDVLLHAKKLVWAAL